MKEKISAKIGNEDIVFAEQTNREQLEFILVSKNRNVFLFDVEGEKHQKIYELKFPIKYSEDSFKLAESRDEPENFLQIQSYGNYLSITQKYGQNGVVLNLENPEFEKKLKRGDYCVEFCVFPIAFFQRENQIFLIHGTDWNRLDVTCLETDELKTERKVDYETKSNYFDYFHSSLSISPDEKYFTSNGWIWHPFGQITLYSIEEFLNSYELSHKEIELTEKPFDSDWDRPLSWVDEKTLAIGFTRSVEDYGETKYPNEILFFDVLENKITKRVEFNGFSLTSEGEVGGELFFNSTEKHFIGLNTQSGLLISNIDGKEIYKDSSLTSHKYSPKHKFIYRVDYEKQFIEITEIK
jgi:hypothetical protein